MKMVDSSSWVHALRRHGDETARERVRILVTSGQAVWCAAVRLELWAGVGAEMSLAQKPWHRRIQISRKGAKAQR